VQYPNPTELNSQELLARRNTVLEHQAYQEHKQTALRHVRRCYRPGLDLLGVLESEIQDSAEEQQRNCDELARIDRELQRRRGEQLPLFAPEPTPAAA